VQRDVDIENVAVAIIADVLSALPEADEEVLAFLEKHHA